jgi:protein-S-isoprenylcysteine O-methyltransferase Ste14
MTARGRRRLEESPARREKGSETKALHQIAAAALAFEMPVPLYWLVLHGRVEFWRKHKRAGYLCAVAIAWGGVDALLFHFRAQLFRDPSISTGAAGAPPFWAIAAGLLLIAADAFLLTSVEIELGGHRLVGHAELTGRGEMTERGLYTWVRHPRYLGMILAVLGACLLAGTGRLWVVVALWLAIALVTIQLEERELRVRFGPAYIAYAQRVPALLPLRREPRRG